MLRCLRQRGSGGSHPHPDPRADRNVHGQPPGASWSTRTPAAGRRSRQLPLLFRTALVSAMVEGLGHLIENGVQMSETTSGREPGAVAVHGRLHADVRGVADVRHPRHARSRRSSGSPTSQLSWLIAVAVLNGSLWRLPAGHDHRPHRRPQGRDLRCSRAPRCPPSSSPRPSPTARCSCWPSSSASPATPSAPASPGTPPGTPRERQGFALGVFGAGNVGASVTKFIGPAADHRHRRRHLLRLLRRRLADRPGVLRRRCSLVVAALVWFGHARATTGRPARASRCASSSRPLRQHAGLAVQPLLRGRLRRLRRPGRLAAEVLRRQLRRHRSSRRPCSPRRSSSRRRCCVPFGGWFSDRFGRPAGHVLDLRRDARRRPGS